MIGRVIRIDSFPDIDGNTHIVLHVDPDVWANKHIGDDRVPFPNEIIKIDVIGKPVYVTGHNENGDPVWDLSAPENNR
jgi:hypothetical protein